MLPFFDGADQLDPRAAYTQQGLGTDPQRFAPYTKEQITREYGHATDRWKTPDFEFSIYTPFGPIPDPATADTTSLRDALLPAVTAELIVDNRTGTSPKTAFFAINFHEGGTRILDTGIPPTHAGFALRAHLGVAAHVVGWEIADAAHVAWLTTGSGAYRCASDQIVNGRAQGSRFYPRLITTALWLTE